MDSQNKFTPEEELDEMFGSPRARVPRVSPFVRDPKLGHSEAFSNYVEGCMEDGMGRHAAIRSSLKQMVADSKRATQGLYAATWDPEGYKQNVKVRKLCDKMLGKIPALTEDREKENKAKDKSNNTHADIEKIEATTKNLLRQLDEMRKLKAKNWLYTRRDVQRVIFQSFHEELLALAQLTQETAYKQQLSMWSSILYMAGFLTLLLKLMLVTLFRQGVTLIFQMFQPILEILCLIIKFIISFVIFLIKMLLSGLTVTVAALVNAFPYILLFIARAEGATWLFNNILGLGKNVGLCHWEELGKEGLALITEDLCDFLTRIGLVAAELSIVWPLIKYTFGGKGTKVEELAHWLASLSEGGEETVLRVAEVIKACVVGNKHMNQVRGHGAIEMIGGIIELLRKIASPDHDHEIGEELEEDRGPLKGKASATARAAGVDFEVVTPGKKLRHSPALPHAAAVLPEMSVPVPTSKFAGS